MSFLNCKVAKLGLLVASWMALGVFSGVVQAQEHGYGVQSVGPMNNAPCLDAWNGPIGGQTVSAGTCHRNAPQDFRVFDGGGGVQLIAIGPLCLAARKPGQNGSELTLLVCNPSDVAQRWVSSGSFHEGPGLFVGQLANGGRCLDLKGNPLAVGLTERREVVLWDCNGQSNQKWMFANRGNQTWQRVN
jgi:hypothetical protein